MLNLHLKGFMGSGHEKLEITSEFFLILNFHCILNVVFFLLADSQASEFYVQTFRNTLSVPVGRIAQSV